MPAEEAPRPEPQAGPQPGPQPPPEPGPAPFSIICLSSEDWHAALPTNRQQIMRRAAGAGHRVVFVETGRFLGRHVADLAAGRGGTRRSLLRRLLGGEQVAERIAVRKAAVVVPRGQRHALANRINAAVLRAQVRRIARGLPQPVAVWLYDPCAAGAVGAPGDPPVAYDCVDDYAEQVGDDPLRRAVVAAGDERAATTARVVFATSSALHAKQRARNPRTHLVRNVGDFAHFAPASDRAHAEAALRDLPGPVLGFAGNLLAGKVDFDLLEAVARARPAWTVVLAGPAHDDTAPRVAALARLPNVRWLGPRAYAELPRTVAAFDIGLIPYRENDYTRSCFPLKLYEYLAAGKPVVASGLPELAGMEPDVRLAGDAAAFAAAVEEALDRAAAEGSAGVARRQAIAAANTWESRAATQLQLMAEALA